MEENNLEVLEELLKKRIEFLESEIAKIHDETQKAIVIRISMQGGIIELKKLLDSIEKTKILAPENFNWN